MTRWWPAALGVCSLALLPSVGHGAELRGLASVVDVVPLGGAADGGDCAPPRPSGLDLAALLAWDLRLDCPDPAPPVAGYRVFYRWDGRTYSLVMDRHPGATLPVRVRLD